MVQGLSDLGVALYMLIYAALRSAKRGGQEQTMIAVEVRLFISGHTEAKGNSEIGGSCTEN